MINVKNPLLEVAGYIRLPSSPDSLVFYILGAGSMPTGAEEYDFIAFAARISWLCQGRLRKSAGYLDKYWQPSVGCLWARSALKFGGFALASWCWNMLKQSQNWLMTELLEGYPWPLEVSDILQEALYSRAADKARSSTYRLWTFGGDQAFLFKYEPAGWNILYILCRFFSRCPQFIPILDQDWSENAGKPPLNGLFNGEDYPLVN